MDFLFHSLSDKEKEDIRKEAKKIIDDFSEKISKVKVPAEEPVVERKEFEREEKVGKGPDEDFRERMLSNAPEKNKDAIIAETKKWE